MAPTATATREGLHVRGTLEGSRPGRRFTGRDGVEHEPVEVGIRAGDDVIAVEYQSADAALAALPEGAQNGDSVELPVFIRLVKDFDKRYAFVTYRGDVGEPRAQGWQ